MAYEFYTVYERDVIIYCRLFALDVVGKIGYVWDTVANDLVDWDDADIANYAKGKGTTGKFDDTIGSPTQNNHTGLYFGDAPGHTNFAKGRYLVVLYLQNGTSPSLDDQFLGMRELNWQGDGELTALKILVNKAIQNKTTGAINYYDDDGETIILTHTPTDGESIITRTPN